jgi:hypothetical protein
MAYTDPGDIASNAVVTETYLDNIRASILASAPAVVTTKGDIVAATGANAVARVPVGADDSIWVADSSKSAGIDTQIIPACRVYNDANIAVSAATWESLTFNSERFDTDVMHSPTTNEERITIPSGGGGLYHIGGCVSFDISGLADGRCDLGLRILLNGATVIGQHRVIVMQNVGGVSDGTITLNTVYSLSATDYIELQAYTNNAIDAEVVANYSPEFWAIWQRRQ